ncbi:MAG: ion transporter [Planctomycetales bacterium]|nr:ion transporter [Planctomycetales bacterium]
MTLEPSTTEPPRKSGPAEESPESGRLRQLTHDVIFEADTVAGRGFDIALLALIVVSVIAVMLDSVDWIRARWGRSLVLVEWSITLIFTVEYAVRLWCVRRPWRYALSFFGIVDLLSLIPAYLSLLVEGSQMLMVIRTLRLVRAFRIFKLSRYVTESQALWEALRATSAKITVFVLLVMTFVLILGSAMYLIEGPERGFRNIPLSVYWAIVTMTTVGYGDMAPDTAWGRLVASIAMILGYSIIIVPTGIFSVEIIMAHKQHVSTQVCPNCTREGHDTDAAYCKYCGTRL